MNTQKSLRLLVPRLPGETTFNFNSRRADFNAPQSEQADPGRLLALLLKRQARAVMESVTECPPDTLPAHLARLAALVEIVRHSIEHETIPAAEARLSGKQLLYAATVADFLACLEITKATHRAPAVVTHRGSQLEEINRKLDLLAGLFSRSPVLSAVLDEAIAADESAEKGGGL